MKNKKYLFGKTLLIHLFTIHQNEKKQCDRGGNHRYFFFFIDGILYSMVLFAYLSLMKKRFLLCVIQCFKMGNSSISWIKRKERKSCYRLHSFFDAESMGRPMLPLMTTTRLNKTEVVGKCVHKKMMARTLRIRKNSLDNSAFG